jgi:SAM-dependent methyltransferase
MSLDRSSPAVRSESIAAGHPQRGGTIASLTPGSTSYPATTTTGHPWDKAAEGWSRHAALVGEWLHEATSAMIDAARIGPGSRVLDIAAGAGNQTLDIARRVGTTGHVLATDISARSLDLARDKLRAAGLDWVETRVADAQALDLTGSDFDAVTCRLGLMFCRAPLDALRNVRAALKPAGRFSALVFSEPQCNPCIAIIVSTALRHAGLPPPSPGEPGTLLSLGHPGLLAELLDAAGFVDVEVRALAAPMRLPSCQHYIDFVRTAGLPIMAILAPLSAAAQAEAWRDMAAQLGKFTTSAGWQGPNELLLCAATSPSHFSA